jgi:hypothetical protein
MIGSGDVYKDGKQIVFGDVKSDPKTNAEISTTLTISNVSFISRHKFLKARSNVMNRKLRMA